MADRKKDSAVCDRSALNGVTCNVDIEKNPKYWGTRGLLPHGMGGVADPKKHVPPLMCYLAGRGRYALKGVGVENPPKWAAVELPLGWDVADLRKRVIPLHMCYHIRFGRSASKGVRINRREPQNWGALGPRSLGMEDKADPKNMPISTFFPAECDRSALKGMHKSMRTSKIGELWARAPPWDWGVHVCYHVRFRCSWSKGVRI